MSKIDDIKQEMEKPSPSGIKIKRTLKYLADISPDVVTIVSAVASIEAILRTAIGG
jgi:hypothetical protein